MAKEENKSSAQSWVLQYLIENKDLLNLSQVARDSDIPESTLRAIATEKRSLSEDNANKLILVIERLGGGQICQ